jgi:glycosyltransferase involved in cell wall biosynthesis
VFVTKLIIQIPCLNEALTLPATLRDLPTSIPGIDVIETLVIDDGSRDDTVAVAQAHGVHHIVRFRRNKGLAAAFAAGIDASLKLGADFIVNTDADNQYAGADIATLLAPLISGQADICIGDRNIQALSHLSSSRKLLQHWGSWVVRQVSNTTVPDTTSGFRAYTREAALRMTIVSEFSYTLESIIQAGKKRMAIAHVPVSTNARTRESRLFDSVYAYIKRSAATIVRIYASYEPLKVFSYIGGTMFGLGLLIWIRFLYYYFTGTGLGHVQSLILSAVLMIVGFQVLMIGLVADLIGGSRKLLEDLVYRVRLLELREPDASKSSDRDREHEREMAGAAHGDRWDRHG